MIQELYENTAILKTNMSGKGNPIRRTGDGNTIVITKGPIHENNHSGEGHSTSS